MKHHITAFTRLLGAAAFSTLVAACSGGSSSSGSSTPVVPLDFFRISCTVSEIVNGAKVPVDNALVLFNAKDTSYSDSTGSDGKCVVNVPAAAVTSGGETQTQVAASVIKEGFESSTIICPIAKPGTECKQDVVLVRITTNTSIPENGDVVTHIGDGIFDGQINSKFQTDTVGNSVNFIIADWGTKLQNLNWTRATIVLDAKGWQTTVAPGCTNTIALVGIGSQIQPGGDSVTTGEWSASMFEFDVSQVGRSGPATLSITSGNCGGTADIDDVETNRIRVYYCDAATVGACTPKP